MSISQSEKADAFAALHNGPGAFVIPNPWDIGTARVLAGLGFKALATTSAGFAFSIGRRDGGISRDEALQHSREIVEATPLPVSADMENGYDHSPEGCAETIRRAAEVGLVGASIEDYSDDRDKPIYDLGHATDRIAAAVEAARALDFRFTLTARAENFLRGRPDLDDTIARLQAFEAAGADVLYAPGLRDLAEIKTVCQAVSKPVNVVVMGITASLSLAALSEAGVRRVSLGSALSRMAFGGFLSAARQIADQGTFTFADQAPSYGEVAHFMAPDRADQ